MKHKILFFILICTSIIATSCTKGGDFYLRRTIFIEDENSPGLPIYSEWGYNTFGAYIDRAEFVSTDMEQPVKVFVRNDSCHIQLAGSYNSQQTTIDFSIADFTPKDESELLSLDNKTFDLSDKKLSTSLNIGTQTHPLQSAEGELKIKRAQKLFVDKEFEKVVLSGTFHIKALYNNQPISVSDGRFDLGVSENNFFDLQEKP